MGGDGRRRHRDSPQLTFRRVIRRATFSASPWEPVGYCGRKPMYPSTPSHRLHVSLRFLASRRLRLPGATRLRSARLRRLAFFARRRGVYRMAGIPFLPNASTAAPVRTARLSHIRFPALSATTSAAHTAASSRIAMFTSPKRITRSMATSPDAQRSCPDGAVLRPAGAASPPPGVEPFPRCLHAARWVARTVDGSCIRRCAQRQRSRAVFPG